MHSTSLHDHTNICQVFLVELQIQCFLQVLITDLVCVRKNHTCKQIFGKEGGGGGGGRIKQKKEGEKGKKEICSAMFEPQSSA